VTATIRGADITIELFLSGAWLDITCQTTTAEWQWGAPEALGPLTECEGGTLRVSLYDPDREYDPDNPDSPLLGLLKVGLGMRVTVDGSPAWTGVLQTWAWDRASRIADLNGLDPIGQLSIRILPERFTMAPVMATSASQAKFVLDFVEWPTAKRLFPDGDSGVERGNHVVEGSALDALHRIRFAELGRLFPLRDGGIGWYDRDGPAPPAPSAVINCGGVGLTDMWRVMGLGRVRNRVVVSGGYGVFGQPRPPDEYRSVTTSFEFLAFAFTAPAALPWDLWAQAILDQLDPPPVLTMLGTIVPQGDEVAQIVTAEFGDRWTVTSTLGDPDKVVQVFGQRVTVTPGTIEVDVVTEDIFVPVPTLHRTAGTGSGYLSSTNAISYANARAGVAVTVTIGSGPAPQYRIGQLFGGGPSWEILESFLWFDTSSIPAGATIISAEFAAMFHPHWNGLSPPPAEWAHFDVELRGGYAWRPTLEAADWRPGAGIAAGYPLRASINTARALKDSFATFEDAGAGLAAAIVKGGETQLFIVSSRTTVGTAPASTSVFEDLAIDFPRLRVTYSMPASGGTYRATTMAISGLVGYWRLGEASGTVAAEERGAHPGTYLNTPTLGVTGALTADANTAVTFTGPQSERVTVPDAAALDLGDTFSFSAWVKISALFAEDDPRFVIPRYLLSKGPAAYGVRLETGNQLGLVAANRSVIAISTVALDTNWHHVAVTKSGASVHLYVDGVDRTGTVTNATLTNTTTHLTIGADDHGGEGGVNDTDHFTGTIDEVALFNRALTPAEVANQYGAR
jgi:hypothetical protein